MEKWEYIEERYEYHETLVDLPVWLNKFGQEGWELVTTSSLNSDYYGVRCIFKRKIK